MTNRIGAILTVTVLPLLFACSSMEVQTAADPQVDLSRYKTYAWAPEVILQGRTSPLDQTVKSSVERAMASKGFVPAKQGAQPDLLIGYFGASRDTVNYSASPGYGYPMYPYYGTAYVTREGSLTLQFIDPKSNQIVWQGTATDVISDAGASQEQVAKAVDELFERYPKT